MMIQTMLEKVHIGLDLRADIGGQEINVTETDTLPVKFDKELDGYEFETWSQIYVKQVV